MTTLEFDAVVEDGRGGGAHVSLPAETAEVFGTRARFPVHATFDGVAYRGSTMPVGEGMFCIGLSKAVRAETGVHVGDVVHVVVVRDSGERTVEIPDDLLATLQGAGLTARFHSMSFTDRKEFVRWIVSAKRPETRERRLATMIEMISAGKRLS